MIMLNIISLKKLVNNENLIGVVINKIHEDGYYSSTSYEKDNERKTYRWKKVEYEKLYDAPSTSLIGDDLLIREAMESINAINFRNGIDSIKRKNSIEFLYEDGHTEIYDIETKNCFPKSIVKEIEEDLDDLDEKLKKLEEKINAYRNK